MLATQLTADNFCKHRSDAEGMRQTFSHWVNHFFGMMPEEVIEEIHATIERYGREPDGDDCGTDKWVQCFSLDQLAVFWHAFVLPAAGVCEPANGKLKHRPTEGTRWQVAIFDGEEVIDVVRQLFSSRLEAFAVCALLNTARGWGEQRAVAELHQVHLGSGIPAARTQQGLAGKRKRVPHPRMTVYVIEYQLPETGEIVWWREPMTGDRARCLYKYLKRDGFNPIIRRQSFSLPELASWASTRPLVNGQAV